MYSYKEWKLFESMSVEQAKSILGISGEVTPEEVKKAYKAKAREHHPDMGGDVEMMKQVNIAYDKLKDYKEKSPKFDWEQLNKEYRGLTQAVNDIIKKSFDTQVFLKYFEGIFDKKFKIESMRYVGEGEQSPSYAGIHVIFASEDESIQFNMRAIVYLVELRKSAALGSKAFEIPLNIYGDGFFEGRKYKIVDRGWSVKSNSLKLNNPEDFFPKAKLLKHVSKKTRTKATRKDYLAAITKILKATVLSNGYFVPLEGDIGLYFSRITFMRKGSWIIDFYKKDGASYRYNERGWSFVEEPELIDVFLSLKGKNKKQITDILNKYKQSKGG